MPHPQPDAVRRQLLGTDTGEGLIIANPSNDELTDAESIRLQAQLNALAVAWKNGTFQSGQAGGQGTTQTFDDFIDVVTTLMGLSRGVVTGRVEGAGGKLFASGSLIDDLVKGRDLIVPEFQTVQDDFIGPRQFSPTPPPSRSEQFASDRTSFFPDTAAAASIRTGQAEPQFPGRTFEGRDVFAGNLRSDPFEFEEGSGAGFAGAEAFGQSPVNPIVNQEFLSQNQPGVTDIQGQNEAFLATVPGQRGLFQSAINAADLTPNQTDFFKGKREAITNKFLADRSTFALGGGDPEKAPKFQDFIQDFDFQGTFQNLTPNQRQVGVTGPRASDFNRRVTFQR